MNTSQLLLNSAGFASYRFNVDFETKEVVGLLMLNSVATVFTFGLFLPWAINRVVQYKLHHIKIVPATNWDSFIETAKQQSQIKETRSVLKYNLGL
jgi:uncharacterized membrane protein YjgN (DUF898 family)